MTGLPKTSDPGDHARDQARSELVGQAANHFNGPLIELIDSIRRDKEQTIVHDDLDKLTLADWAGEAGENARVLVQEFSDYLQEHRDQIEALEIYFSQPARRSEVTYRMIKQLLDQLQQDRPKLAPLRVWRAYAHLDDYQGEDPVSALTALVALIRRVAGLDQKLTRHSERVRRNFQNWILKRHSGAGEKFTEEQMDWLRMIRDHLATSFTIERDDLDMAPFYRKGGMGQMYALFGERMDEVMAEMNEALSA
jgi:type I restriction enzyme, R subunit